VNSEADNNRVVVITGGVRGIGRAVAVRLSENGWNIAACYRSNEEAAQKLRDELGALGRPSLILQADISKAANADTLVRRVEEKFGRIDALLNCAGLYHRISLMEESLEGWHSMFDNNLHPVFYLSRLVAPGMAHRKWGRIINFGVVNADQQTGQPFVTAHYIAKVGVLVLTRSLARILAPHGITVNSISPGFLETGNVNQEEVARMAPSIPAGYIGSPEDAVGAVCYLLSNAARYVNGTNIHVSGAWGV
jgi:3-oxoacyl-[acyl-carrier protein] reductase